MANKLAITKPWMMNRGRIQAQGDGTEKSSSWAINGDFTKTMGLNKVDELEQQLSRAELSKRDIMMNPQNQIKMSKIILQNYRIKNGKKNLYRKIYNRGSEASHRKCL